MTQEDYGTVELKIVEGTPDGAHQIRPVHLVVSNKTPIKLGSGRYAVVVAAASQPDLATAREFFALKFLKENPESTSESRNARTRYFEELSKTVKFGSEEGSFVCYVGCSRIKKVPRFAYGSSNQRDKAEEAFERELSEQLVETEKHNKEVAKGLGEDFLRDIQGDFFAMTAEEGTLEDLLVEARAWSSRAIFSVRRGLQSRLTRLSTKKRVHARRFLEEIRNDDLLREISPRDYLLTKNEKPAELPRKNCSGFAILEYIGRCAPSIKNRIAVSFGQELTTTVSAVHSMGAGLAHRDLKLGNFLFSWVSNTKPQMKLSDLGFVSERKTAKTLLGTIDTSVREPGVLALGSHLYRAPEQLASWVDLRFEVVDGDKGTVRFSDIGDVVGPTIGEWVECREVDFYRGNSNAPVHKARIKNVEIEAGLVTLTVDGRIRVRSDTQNKEYCAGYLIRPSGQHTDIFAVGSMLYLISSIGNNPEKLYVKCLEPPETRSANRKEGTAYISEGREFYDLLYADCFSLALSLCVDYPDFIAEDLAPYLDECGPDTDAAGAPEPAIAGESQRATIDREATSGGAATDPEPSVKTEGADGLTVGAMIERIALLRPSVYEHLGKERPLPRIKRWRSRRGDYGGDVDRKRFQEYLRLLREGPTVQQYLRDSNGYALPFPIVYEVVRCMVRDNADSYVRREDQNMQSYFDVDCHETAGRIAENLGTILEGAGCVRPNLDRYSGNLGGDGVGLFCCVRICFPHEEEKRQQDGDDGGQSGERQGGTPDSPDPELEGTEQVETLRQDDTIPRPEAPPTLTTEALETQRPPTGETDGSAGEGASTESR